MLHPSKRGELMPSSPIRKLAPFAEEATKRGLKVYHLNIGQPDIETPPMALQAVKDADIKTLGYSHSAGNESYRKKLVQYYHNSNIEITQDQILVTTGGSEGLVFAMMACLDPGDEVIIPEPFYANYNGFALPPIPEFEKLISPKTKGIMICNPNNPTGYLYSKEEMEQLEDICLRHNLYLFSDEAYREFCYDGEYTSALHLKKIPEHVVLIDTISKRYSACGARIGALITRNKKVYDSVMKFAQARLSPPGLAQILAEAALDLPSTYFDIPRAAYISRRNLLVKRLNEMPGVFCPTPGGAFYVMARLPIDDCDTFCQWLLESFSHNGQTLMLAPASGFYETQSLGKDQVRFAYVIKNEDIDAAMDCLEEALKIYPGRTN